MTDESVCVLCGQPWQPSTKNVCECGGFATWGAAKGADPDSWELYLRTDQLVDQTIEVSPSVAVDVADGKLIGVETIGRPIDILALAEVLLKLGPVELIDEADRG